MRIAYRNKNDSKTFAKGNKCQNAPFLKLKDHYPLSAIETSWFIYLNYFLLLNRLAFHAYYIVFSREASRWKNLLNRIYNLLWYNKNYTSARMSLKSIVANPKKCSIFNSVAI